MEKQHEATADMTVKELKEIIKREEKYVKSLENKISDIRFDIRGSKRAIAFWKKELAKKGK